MLRRTDKSNRRYVIWRLTGSRELKTNASDQDVEQGLQEIRTITSFSTYNTHEQNIKRAPHHKLRQYLTYQAPSRTPSYTGQLKHRQPPIPIQTAWYLSVGTARSQILFFGTDFENLKPNRNWCSENLMKSNGNTANKYKKSFNFMPSPNQK